MKKILFASLVVVFIAAQVVLAHDPRTVAKEFTHAMNIEGAGKLSLTFKSLHFNETGFNARKQRAAIFNRIWGSIGKLDTEFDVVISGVKVPKGSYGLGFNFDENDNYKLVLKGASEISIPMQASLDAPRVNYLTLDIRPENNTDTFTLEARYGPLRASAETKVPYLSSHDHGAQGEHKHDQAKPAEKKP